MNHSTHLMYFSRFYPFSSGHKYPCKVIHAVQLYQIHNLPFKTTYIIFTSLKKINPRVETIHSPMLLLPLFTIKCNVNVPVLHCPLTW